MRFFAAVFALFLLACGQEGQPRDRSLLIKDQRERQHRLELARARARRAKSRAAATSVIGLVKDPLASHYAEGAQVVVRFDNMTALMREAGPRMAEVRKALPKLGLVAGKPDQLLRRILRLPEPVVFDPLRPFAFVRVEQGWAAVVPTRPREEAGGRLRALDGIYCVAGDPAVVAAYQPGYRKGFYLPGDCSLILPKPDAIKSLGKDLSAVFGPVGIELGFLDGVLGPIPKDIARVDAALRFGAGGLRCDVRIAPMRDSPTAVLLEQLRPRSPEAVRWLPPDGTIYVELGTPLMKWDGLMASLARDPEHTTDAEQPTGAGASVRQALALLDDESAAMLHLDPDGSGRVILVARLSDPEVVRDYLGSADFQALLKKLAGPGGHLEWMPEVFTHGEVEVSAVTGHFSRHMLMEWRDQGILKATLGMLLRGPVVVYLAVVGDKLCLLAGSSARSEIERFIDALANSVHLGNQHAGDVDPLFRQRLGAVSVDLAALFDGTREAAPFWHKNGQALREIALELRMPVAMAATIEGGALRLACRVPPRMLAEAAAKVSAALAEPEKKPAKD